MEQKVTAFNNPFLDELNGVFNRENQNYFSFMASMHAIITKHERPLTDLYKALPQIINYNLMRDVTGAHDMKENGALQEKWLAHLHPFQEFMPSTDFFFYYNRCRFDLNSFISDRIVDQVLPLFAPDYRAVKEQEDLLHFLLSRYELSSESLVKFLNLIKPFSFNMDAFAYAGPYTRFGDNDRPSVSYLEKAILQPNTWRILVEAGVPVLLPKVGYNALVHLLDVPVVDNTRVKAVDEVLDVCESAWSRRDYRAGNLGLMLVNKTTPNNIEVVKSLFAKRGFVYTAEDLREFLVRTVDNPMLTEHYVEVVQKINLYDKPEYRQYLKSVIDQMLQEFEDTPRQTRLAKIIKANSQLMSAQEAGVAAA